MSYAGILGQAIRGDRNTIFAFSNVGKEYVTGKDLWELFEGDPLIILDFKGEEYLVLSPDGVAYVHESQVYLDFVVPVYEND